MDRLAAGGGVRPTVSGWRRRSSIADMLQRDLYVHDEVESTDKPTRLLSKPAGSSEATTDGQQELGGRLPLAAALARAFSALAHHTEMCRNRSAFSTDSGRLRKENYRSVLRTWGTVLRCVPQVWLCGGSGKGQLNFSGRKTQKGTFSRGRGWGWKRQSARRRRRNGSALGDPA